MSKITNETRSNNKEAGCASWIAGLTVVAAGAVCCASTETVGDVFKPILDLDSRDISAEISPDNEVTQPDGTTVELPPTIWELADFPNQPINEQISLNANSEFPANQQPMIVKLFDYYTELAERYGLETFLKFVPAYQVNLAFSDEQSVILGLNRGEINPSLEAILSLNYGQLYANPETRAALEYWATWFHENVLAVEGTGADKTVAFQTEPTDLALSDMLVQPPDDAADNHYRTPEIVVQGTTELSHTMYAFFIAAVQKLEEQGVVDLTDGQVKLVASLLYNEWFLKNTTVRGGNYLVQFMDNGELQTLTDTRGEVRFQQTPWEVREFIMNPAANNARPEQEDGTQCIVIQELPEDKETHSGRELDAVDAMYSVRMVVDLEGVPNLGEGNVQGAFTNLSGRIALLPMHEYDPDGFENPTVYEETSSQGEADVFTWIRGCAPGQSATPLAPVSTPVAPQRTPDGTPSTPATPWTPETPEIPTPETGKSPDTDIDGNAGYTNPNGGSVIDRVDPVDVNVATPEELPAAPEAESTPPSLEGF